MGFPEHRSLLGTEVIEGTTHVSSRALASETLTSSDLEEPLFGELLAICSFLHLRFLSVSLTILATPRDRDCQIVFEIWNLVVPIFSPESVPSLSVMEFRHISFFGPYDLMWYPLTFRALLMIVASGFLCALENQHGGSLLRACLSGNARDHHLKVVCIFLKNIEDSCFPPRLLQSGLFFRPVRDFVSLTDRVESCGILYFCGRPLTHVYPCGSSFLKIGLVTFQSIHQRAYLYCPYSGNRSP